MQLSFAETNAGKTAHLRAFQKPFRDFESTERFVRVQSHGIQHLQSYSLIRVLILSSRVPQNDLFSGRLLIRNTSICADFTFLVGISVDRNANNPL